MVQVMLLLVVAGIASVVTWFVIRRQQGESRAVLDRYRLEDDGQRIPLVEASEPDATADVVPPAFEIDLADRSTREELARFLSPTPGDVESADRVVETPDGPQLLSEPPFRARKRMMPLSKIRFAEALGRRLPPWMSLCPRVRLDTLVVPQSPELYDAKEWATWRRRVRFRAVDMVLIDRRTWTPVCALLFEEAVDARQMAGGRDRIIREVLEHVGVPVVALTGKLSDDWVLIRPLIEEAMLERALDGDGDGEKQNGWDASAAVSLLRLDDEEFALE